MYHSSGLKGPINFLEDYLIQRKYEVFHLEHPLDVYIGKKTLFSDNQKEVFSKKRNGGNIVNLFIDFYLSLRTISQNAFEVFIGGNNFDTLPAIFLKQITGKSIQKIIYFSSDFSENRYKNSFMNAIYTLIESFVLKHADVVISNTKRAETKRLQLGLSPKKSIVIPNGVHLSQPVFSEKQIKKDTFLYIGNVTKEHGIYDFVVAMQKSIKKLVIIGQGDQYEILKNYCKSQHINHQFFYKMSHAETIAYLQKFNGFGLAPYTRDAGWTWYSSPLKVNEYIACGVPIIVSNIPEISSYIDKKKIGVVYDILDSSEIRKKLKDFNTTLFSNKARVFYNTYSYDVLYKSLLL